MCAVSLFGCGGNDGGDSGEETNATTALTTTTPVTPETDTGTTVEDPTNAGTETSAAPTSEPTGEPGTGDPTTDAPTTGDTSTSTGSTTGTTADPTGETQTSTGSAALTASATLEPKSGSQVSGTVLFTDNGGGTVDLVVTVSGVEPPGTHALHIHEFPDCSAPDGNSTGNHWNPNGTTLGELGTVEIANDGTGVFMKSDAWSIGTGADNDIVNRSIIIHAESGGGTRIACGVIAQD